MRYTTESDTNEELTFLNLASKYFAENPECTIYTKSDIVPGCFFALLWGISKECVLVLKLDSDHMPSNYIQAVRKHIPEATCQTLK